MLKSLLQNAYEEDYEPNAVLQIVQSFKVGRILTAEDTRANQQAMITYAIQSTIH